MERSNNKNIIHLDAAEGAGIAWIKNTRFSSGTIEFDAKGKNVMQQSFTGIAFHGINDSSYDCIYFRRMEEKFSENNAHFVVWLLGLRGDWYLAKDYIETLGRRLRTIRKKSGKESSYGSYPC